ncbi:MAG: FtsQ-type POTRA domain-containing protein [Thermodesulfobacteriota bacterium]
MLKKVSRKNRKKKTAGCARYAATIPALKVTAGLVVLLAVSIGFVYGYAFFIRSDCLRINDVQVKGLSLLDREAVVHRAGIATGMNIMAVNLSVARRRLQADPWIADVRISRVLPSTIVIDIREHTPLAILDWGGSFLINSHREVFKRLEPTDPSALPVISGIECGDLDEKGHAVGPALNAALDVVEMGVILGERIPGMSIRKVIADRDTGLTLYAFDAIDEVRLGFDDDNDSYITKFRQLGYMLSHCSSQPGTGRLAAAGFEYPDRVVVKAVTAEAYVANSKGGSNEGTGHHRRS